MTSIAFRAYALTILCATTPATATLITFTDRTAFITATGATDPTAGLPLGATSPLATGTLTFTDAPGSFFAVVNNSTLIPGNEINVSGVENFDVAIGGIVFAFGFDFHEPTAIGLIDGCNFLPGCVDSTFTVTLLSGASSVGSFTFNAPDDVLAFVGVQSDTAFDGVEIRETPGVIGIHDDNEFFGNFLAGTTALPEPSAVLLLATGVAALAWRVRRELTL